MICYDIEDDGFRQKVANKLIAEGLDRMQWSVFAGDLTDRRMEQLKKWLEKEILKRKPPGNSIIIVNLTPSDFAGMILLGEPSFDYAAMVKPPNTLFL